VFDEELGGATVLAGRPSSQPSDVGPRFEPGSIINHRYRVVALLGKGGMGEVYRADDLKLGQSVALKFLPVGLEQDPERLRLLLDEVRTARQVTHANVCRVHDVDEFEGQHFLSMEYVDGEDLSTSLRRIGRLSEERAVEVARQICAGLAAAHDAGVLHRDLKPANVMLDGRGDVKLTDFGLASLVDSDDDSRVGTPAYMAPEQLSDGKVSVRSDVYALGLTLYELFTGRPVFQADTMAEMSSLHASSVPSRPTSHVDSLDPAIERVVLHCLEKDPASRPSSAISVAAALPGGDPLAAALAAGETPSPELVAESGEQDAMRPLLALGLGLLIVLATLGGSRWAATQSLINYLPFEKRPEVLQDRALDLLAELGYVEDVYVNPGDRAWGWLTWSDVARQIAEADSSSDRWSTLRERADAGGYWYRQSPFVLDPIIAGQPAPQRGGVGLTNPPATDAGEVMVLFNLDGSLRRFELLPRRFAQESPSEPDWGPLFAAAELDTARFRAVEPRYGRFFVPDLRRAWLGTIDDDTEVEYRVEAAAFEGRPVLFNVAEAATLEALGRAPETFRPSVLNQVLQSAPGIVILVILLLAGRLAAHNVQRQRFDRRGALRFALAMAMLVIVTEALRSHVLWTRDFTEELWLLFSQACVVGLLVWTMYVAVEPVGRQVWPTMFISTSRLLSRTRPVWRDPVLGRGLLAGMIFGAVYFVFAFPFRHWIGLQSGGPPPNLWGINLVLLSGTMPALSELLDVTMQIGIGFLKVAALVLLQRWVGRRWLAVGLALFLWTLMTGFGTLTWFLIGLGNAVIMMVVLLRWGVVSMVMVQITAELMWDMRAVDYGYWTSTGAVFALVLALILVIYGMWAATGSTLRAVGQR
jgi:serine/threonine-protein kinase